MCCVPELSIKSDVQQKTRVGMLWLPRRARIEGSCVTQLKIPSFGFRISGIKFHQRREARRGEGVGDKLGDVVCDVQPDVDLPVELQRLASGFRVQGS